MKAPADWYRSFFSGVAVEFWLAATTDDDTLREVGFLENALALSAGARVLDVPAGGGRHALGLAARGHRVTGVDLSPEYVAVARARAKERGLDVAFEERDMSELAFDGAFDAAYCFGNSFGYLDDEGNARFLRGIAKALRPGGRFALETYMTAESLFPDFHEKSWHEAGGILCVMRGHFDPPTSRVHNACTFVKDGHTTHRDFSVRIHGYRELVELLLASGFASCEGFDGLSSEPFRLGARRLVLVATKA